MSRIAGGFRASVSCCVEQAKGNRLTLVSQKCSKRCPNLSEQKVFSVLCLLC